MSERFIHKGVEIRCSSNGYFYARVVGRDGGEPVEICRDTLSQMRAEIDKVLTIEKNRRSRPSIPVYLFDGQEFQLVEWRGFQTNSGVMLVTRSDGKKQRLKIAAFPHNGQSLAWLVPVDLAKDGLLELGERYAASDAETKRLRLELGEAVKAVGVSR